MRNRQFKLVAKQLLATSALVAGCNGILDNPEGQLVSGAGKSSQGGSAKGGQFTAGGISGRPGSSNQAGATSAAGGENEGGSHTDAGASAIGGTTEAAGATQTGGTVEGGGSSGLGGISGGMNTAGSALLTSGADSAGYAGKTPTAGQAGKAQAAGSSGTGGLGFGGSCVRLTCAQLGIQCGNAPDGCGGTLVCTCPDGRACNPTTHECTVACEGKLSCMGGCCDGTNCQDGTSNIACGTATSICQSCATYSSCKNQKCTNACTIGSDCKNGGCCQDGACQAGTKPTSCGSSCIDCTSQSAGHQCVGGVCGCSTSADCPTYTACDPTTHKCSVNCDGVNSPCNQGCCNGITCVTGGTIDACGYNGGKCAGCSTSCAESGFTSCKSVSGGGTCSCHSAYIRTCPSSSSGVAWLTDPSSSSYRFCGCTTVADCPLPPATRCVSNQCLP